MAVNVKDIPYAHGARVKLAGYFGAFRFQHYDAAKPHLALIEDCDGRRVWVYVSDLKPARRQGMIWKD